MTRARKAKRPRGRPPAITPAKRLEILAALAVGGSRNEAADYVDVGRSTLSETIDRDPDFAEQVKRAEAKGKIKHLKRIDGADAWQASAWMLERKYPQEFGRKFREDPAADHKPNEQPSTFRYEIVSAPEHPEPQPEIDTSTGDADGTGNNG